MSRRRSTLLCALISVLAATVATAGPALGVGYIHPTVVSANPVDHTPHVKDGTVLAIATVGSTVYVGGTFTHVVAASTSTALPRNYLFAFDRSTGRVLPFAPALNGAVETIAAAPDGASIIIGGRFTTVGGATQRSLAVLTPAGERVSTFKAKTNGYVTKVLVRQGRLLVGGRFSTANGVARANLAAFDATNGALDTSFDVPVTQGRTKSSGIVTKPAIVEMDANATGSRLVVVGNFQAVAGQRRMQIAMIDLTSNALAGWFTNRYPNDVSGSTHAYQCSQSFETQMRDVEFSPNGVYFVVVTTGGAPDYNRRSLCDTAARWDPSVATGTDVQPTWFNCTGGDTLYSVAVTAPVDTTGTSSSGVVYVGGHQRWLDNCGGRDSATKTAFAADGIGAIDARTGFAIRDWNPGRTRGVGAEELVAEAEGLYVGSDTEQLGGEYHARLGLFPLN